MQPTILFVDIDSTLVENRFSFKVISTLVGEIAAATGLAPEDIGRSIGEENNRRQLDDPDNPLTMDWDDILDTIAARNGVQLSRRVIDLWREYADPGMVDVLDNASHVFQQIKAPHRTLVIATKGLRKYQDVVLETVGLASLFDDILTPDITGYLKTSPGYFARYTQTPTPTTFIQVGDHYYDDVICAKRNGFYAVMRAPIPELADLDPFERPAHLLRYQEQIHTYPRQGTDVLPDAVVISLEELPAVLPRLEAV
ncbi:MAG: hypothetical protein OHK0046_14220 [Anaerolineae bacterium]